MLRIVSDRWTQFFFDRQWWERACKSAFVFAPHCIMPAAILTVANVVAVIATLRLPDVMRGAVQNNTQVSTGTDLAAVLMMFIAILVCLFVVVLVSMVGLAQWLMKLTIFARAFCDTDGLITAESVGRAQAETKDRWWYVMRLWLVASLYLLVPAIVLSLIIGLGSMRATGLIDLDFYGMQWMDRHDVRITAAVVGSILTIVCSMYTFVVIVFSAISSLPAGRTATVALRETAVHSIALALIVILLLLGNIVLTAPQVIVGLWWPSIAHHWLVETCAMIWLGVASCVTWPLTVAPFCRMTILGNTDSNE